MTQSGRRPLVAGNWKMNGTRASIQVVEAIRDRLSPDLAARIDVLICPPATLIGSCVAAAARSPLPLRGPNPPPPAIGGQNLHARPSGAFTGSISAEMLADLGAKYVIVGHSERRAYHHETDDGVHAKALAARRAGLCGIICVGETKEEREEGRALDIVRAQLAIGVPK